MTFIDKVNGCSPTSGTALFWLGQAGFLIKNSRGKLLALDVYLSDLSERLDGNKRLMMPVADPCDLHPDVILASHEHTDHLDLDSLPAMLKTGATVYCPGTAHAMCLAAGLPKAQLGLVKQGDQWQDSGFVMRAVHCDHGDASPDAVGFLISCDGVTIYFTGDTALRPARLEELQSGHKIDLLLAPINGEYGNMNERDAAMMAAVLAPKLTIPCHFWTFARHRGSPYDFALAMQALAPGSSHYTMCQGEQLLYPHG